LTVVGVVAQTLHIEKSYATISNSRYAIQSPNPDYITYLDNLQTHQVIVIA